MDPGTGQRALVSGYHKSVILTSGQTEGVRILYLSALSVITAAANGGFLPYLHFSKFKADLRFLLRLLGISFRLFLSRYYARFSVLYLLC